MGSISRKMKRQKAKDAMKRLQSKLREKMVLFDYLPTECTSCFAPFDKNDKDMVLSWTTVVRESQGQVHLYCPDCWKHAQNMIGTMNNAFDELAERKKGKEEIDN